MAFGFGFSFPHALGGGFTPASLFSAGEQGAWYDPSDLTTLYQDSAGTTPVTAVEQAVGLMLDKSKGLVLGSQTELVTNGTFDSNITGWSAQSTNVVISWDAGKLKSVTSDTASSYVYQQLTTVVGRWYRVSFAITNGTYRFTVFADSTLSSALTTADNGSTLYFLATTTTATIGYRALTATTLYADNISVREWYLGNHAYQTASTSRPTLRARYNLVTYSEQFDNAAWTKANIGAFGSGSVANTSATTDPLGGNTADYITENTTNGGHGVSATAVATAALGTVFKFSVYAKKAQRSWLRLFLGGLPDSWFNLDNGTLGTVGAGITASISSAGNGWYLCSISGGISFSPVDAGIRINTANNETGYVGTDPTTSPNGIYIWGADLRVANDGVNLPAYQRIAAATDYDTSGFPVYLDFCESFGGTNTDNSMLTNSIDFSGTDKMAVFAGVRKLSDAATGVVAELSATLDSNAGTFLLVSPRSGTVNAPNFVSKGTATANPLPTSSAYPSPVTNVLTGLGNIAGDTATIKANGAQVATTADDQGTGNFGNYPLYIGRRGGTTLPFSGRVYSIVIRGAATSDALIASTEAWVNGKTRAYG